MTEYATSVANLPHDYNTQRYVGWMDNLNCDCTQGAGGNLYNYLFHQKTVNYISKKVSDHLWPLMNRPIVAPDEQIRGMITSVWNAEAGADNAGIYTQDTFNLPRNSFNRITDIVIQSIINQLKNTIEIEQCNNKLDIWNGTLYGDFNKAGLRRHPKIKLRERHPQYMAFNMNY